MRYELSIKKSKNKNVRPKLKLRSIGIYICMWYIIYMHVVHYMYVYIYMHIEIYIINLVFKKMKKQVETS
jgi:hypothetical protein